MNLYFRRYPHLATQRSAILQFPFDTKLERQMKWSTCEGQESAVIRNVILADETRFWLRNAKAMHRIDQARQARKYVHSFFFSVGFSDFMRNSQKKSRVQKLEELALLF